MSVDKHLSAILLNLVFFNFIIFIIIALSSSKTTTITLTKAFAHSHLDYCNSLCYDFPKYSIHRLKKIQNTTARMVTRTSRFFHILPILKSLHWLPVIYRINFKICCLIHCALSLVKPYY